MADYPDSEWTKTVCKIGQGADTCRYLTMASTGWSCEKRASLRPVIDYKVATGQFIAASVNCDGKDSRETEVLVEMQ